MSNSIFTPANVAAVQVDPELLGVALRRMADEHESGEPEPDPSLVCFFAVMDYLGIKPGQRSNENEASSARHSLLVMAVVYRLRSMVKLAEVGHLDAWSNDDKRSGAILIHPALIDAAAKCILQFEGEDHYFDPDEFLQLALEVVEPNEGWYSRK